VRKPPTVFQNSGFLKSCHFLHHSRSTCATAPSRRARCTSTAWYRKQHIDLEISNCDCNGLPSYPMQAHDRCHRIGQMRPVHIHRLVSETTIEDDQPDSLKTL